MRMLCKKCLIEKKADQFSRSNRHYHGLFPWCKACRAIWYKLYYTKNHNRLLQKSAKWKTLHQAQMKQTQRMYRSNNREKINITRQQWSKQNSEKVRLMRQREYKKNQDRIYLQKKRWYQRNHEHLIKMRREKYKTNMSLKRHNRNYQNHRRKTNLQYWLACILRSRLNQALNGNYKNGSAVRNLGCSVAYLKNWLEDFFVPGMTWENKGTLWHIDHVRPLTMFDLQDRTQLLTACHYTNLHPLWAYDNRSKGNSIVRL